MVGSDTARRVFTHTASMRGRMTDVLRDLARFESPSTDPGSQGAVLRRLALLLDEVGFRSRRLPGKRSGGQLFAVPRGRRRGAAIQLLLGHSDTVWPVGTLDRMEVRRENGRMYGPGVYDMKAGLVQLVFALDALRSVRVTPEVSPIVLINTDEETGSLESRAVIERLARLADRAFVLEPSFGPEGALKTGRKGIGRYTVHVHGEAAHAGLHPESGASAILELSHVVQRLFGLNDLARGITVNVGTIDGGLRPNVVAPHGKADVDVRAPTVETADEIDRAIRALRPATMGTRIEVEGGFGRPPMEPAGNRELWSRAREAAGLLGIPLHEASVGGASDGNLTSRHTPTLDGLGAVGGGAHALDESVMLDKLAERSALLALLLLEPRIGNGAVHA